MLNRLMIDGVDWARSRPTAGSAYGYPERLDLCPRSNEREWHNRTLDMQLGTSARLPDQSVGVDVAAQKTNDAHKSASAISS